MTAVRLSKLHATGNDFLVWSWLGPDASGYSAGDAQARALCDRHTGIGADGLIVVQHGSDGAHAALGRRLLGNHGPGRALLEPVVAARGLGNRQAGVRLHRRILAKDGSRRRAPQGPSLDGAPRPWPRSLS